MSIVSRLYIIDENYIPYSKTMNILLQCGHVQQYNEKCYRNKSVDQTIKKKKSKVNNKH